MAEGSRIPQRWRSHLLFECSQVVAVRVVETRPRVSPKTSIGRSQGRQLTLRITAPRPAACGFQAEQAVVPAGRMVGDHVTTGPHDRHVEPVAQQGIELAVTLSIECSIN